MSNARTLLCAVPQPVAVVRKTGSRRSLHLALAAGLIMGFQGLTAGPAAVATIPTGLLARPAVAPQVAAPQVQEDITVRICMSSTLAVLGEFERAEDWCARLQAGARETMLWICGLVGGALLLTSVVEYVARFW